MTAQPEEFEAALDAWQSAVSTYRRCFAVEERAYRAIEREVPFPEELEWTCRAGGTVQTKRYYPGCNTLFLRIRIQRETGESWNAIDARLHRCFDEWETAYNASAKRHRLASRTARAEAACDALYRAHEVLKALPPVTVDQVIEQMRADATLREMADGEPELQTLDYIARLETLVVP